MNDSNEHVGSYYAATRHPVEFPQLQGEHRVDVVVVGGDSEQFDMLAKVRHLRLPGGRWFANPVLALGMLYYRVKELL